MSGNAVQLTPSKPGFGLRGARGRVRSVALGLAEELGRVAGARRARGLGGQAEAFEQQADESGLGNLAEDSHPANWVGGLSHTEGLVTASGPSGSAWSAGAPSASYTPATLGMPDTVCIVNASLDVSTCPMRVPATDALAVRLQLAPVPEVAPLPVSVLDPLAAPEAPVLPAMPTERPVAFVVPDPVPLAALPRLVLKSTNSESLDQHRGAGQWPVSASARARSPTTRTCVDPAVW